MIGLEILFQVKYLPYDNPRPFLSSLFFKCQYFRLHFKASI